MYIQPTQLHLPGNTQIFKHSAGNEPQNEQMPVRSYETKLVNQSLRSLQLLLISRVCFNTKASILSTVSGEPYITMHVLLNLGPVSYTVQAYSGESGAEPFLRRSYKRNKCFPSDVMVLSATWKTSPEHTLVNVHTGEMQNDHKTSKRNYWATSTHPCVSFVYFTLRFFVL